MAPTIVIEISNGNLEAVYSNNHFVRLFVIDRDKTPSGASNIAGPFSPTLVREDLIKALPEDIKVTPELLMREPTDPYFLTHQKHLFYVAIWYVCVRPEAWRP
jgi:hypothetical protein